MQLERRPFRTIYTKDVATRSIPDLVTPLRPSFRNFDAPFLTNLVRNYHFSYSVFRFETSTRKASRNVSRSSDIEFHIYAMVAKSDELRKKLHYVRTVSFLFRLLSLYLSIYLCIYLSISFWSCKRKNCEKSRVAAINKSGKLLRPVENSRNPILPVYHVSTWRKTRTLNCGFREGSRA